MFGLLGDSNLAFVAVAVETGATFVAARHESGALSMAAGYARATGIVSIATTTRGPGLTNATTALISAVRDRVPLVYVVGGNPRSGAQDNQALNEYEIVANTGAEWIPVERPEEISAAVARAFERARDSGGPVVLHVPSDVLEAGAVRQLPTPTARRSRLPPPPEPAALADVARLLSEAKRPVIVAGRGAQEADVAAGLRLLGRRVGALLATSLPATGLFHGDPFSIGFIGGFALPRTLELVNDADVVLAVGTSLSRYTTSAGSLFPDARLVHVDISETAFGRDRARSTAVLGAAGEVVSGLLAQLGDRTQVGYRTTAVRARILRTNGGRDLPVMHDHNSVDPRAALRAIDRCLPRTRRVVVDIGHFSTFPCQVLEVTQAGQLMPAFGFASVGLGLATAIGAAMAQPRRWVHAVIGDGGLLMSLPELDSVARLAPRLIVTVLNDASYAAEVHHLRRHGLPTRLARFPATDFADVARALGMPAVAVRTAADLDALPDLRKHKGPVLVDVRVNPSVVSDRFRRLLEQDNT